MEQNNLSAEEWQAIAEKLAGYLSYGAGVALFTYENKDYWLEKAKKELGYE